MKSKIPIRAWIAVNLALGVSEAFAQVPPPPVQPMPQPPQGTQPPMQQPAQPVQPPAQRPRPNPTSVALPTNPPRFGDALPGLTRAQMIAFADGLEEFQNVETPESGLGPIYNNVSCVACHSQGGVGGPSEIRVTRFGRLINGVFDPLTALGGSLLQQFSINPAVREVIPREANVVAHRQTTPLFGAGLIEAIPDSTILEYAARVKPDGINGHVSQVLDVPTGLMRVGRFGWKAQQATLLAFAGDAYLNEMGITSRYFPTENAPNGNTALLARFDRTADPEDQVDPATNKSDIDLAADFMRLLAPPSRLTVSPASRGGEALFTQVGCATCHVPTMQSGPSTIAALDHKPVALYSDLLLHDMGRLGDGIGQGTATPREMKTAPLWGLRVRHSYLHDGRANSIDDAVREHDGEGAKVRDRYLQLAPPDRRQIVEFLNSI